MSNQQHTDKHVVIIGAGFAGYNAAKKLGNVNGIKVTVLDRRNHFLFQPLLYQVAMAALGPAEIAAPIRSLLAKYRNITVLRSEVTDIKPDEKRVISSTGEYHYDYLIVACGAQHSYFGQEQWEEFAPGLKNLSQATEIRRRVLMAYESAEAETDPQIQKRLLTFVIVGGGPTGVELAGAIGEMSRFTLAKEFRNIDPKLTRVILIDAGSRILAAFDESLSSKATRALETLGVQIWTSSRVTHVDKNGVELGNERIESSTVLWAAGVQVSPLSQILSVPMDNTNRVIVESDLSIKQYPNIFIAGDQACFLQDDKPLPGLASVALQQGQYIGKRIKKAIQGKTAKPFRYFDKGIMATIGRSRAVAQVGRFKFSGHFAWLTWIVVHIYYLSGFKNRLIVTIKWAWSYFTFSRGSRLIVNKEWRSYNKSD